MPIILVCDYCQKETKENMVGSICSLPIMHPVGLAFLVSLHAPPVQPIMCRACWLDYLRKAIVTKEHPACE